MVGKFYSIFLLFFFLLTWMVWTFQKLKLYEMSENVENHKSLKFVVGYYRSQSEWSDLIFKIYYFWQFSNGNCGIPQIIGLNQSLFFCFIFFLLNWNLWLQSNSIIELRLNLIWFFFFFINLILDFSFKL